MLLKFLLLIALGWALFRFSQAVMWILGLRKKGDTGQQHKADGPAPRKRVDTTEAEDADFEEIK